ncbi:MAG: flagellar motor protein [Methylococcales bacterium]|nr:MAG: flagellar motor protein [Methylococcales bacterium]
MDILSIIGFLVSIGALLLGNLLEGGVISSLINGPAIIIVFGGTLGATLLQFPPAIFIRSVEMFLWVFKPTKIDLETQIDQIVKWSNISRKRGLLVLENSIDQDLDPFIQKSLQLLVDGNEPDVIVDILELEISVKESRDYQAARLYEAMGGYAPTVGIIGAVMGLIHVMGNLGEPALLGKGIATAFVATIYGVASANLIFLPIANKLKSHIYFENQAREMIAIGIAAIANNENPVNIKLKLDGYLHPKTRIK